MAVDSSEPLRHIFLYHARAEYEGPGVDCVRLHQLLFSRPQISHEIKKIAHTLVGAAL